MDHAPLRNEIEGAIAAFDLNPDEASGERARASVAALLSALESGEIRSAERTPEGEWRAVEWVRAGILLAFRVGRTIRIESGSAIEFFDRDTLPLRRTDGVGRNIRVVPGGSSVRAGSYLAPKVVVMPPAYVNVGAWVGEGTMIDSHALVGSCAQIGARVHLSAGAQVGGVLEPIGMRPVVIEDEAMIGANCGLFEGVLVGERAVLAPGVILSGSTPLYDLVKGTVHRSKGIEAPLSVPPGAVVVPGSRPAAGAFAEEEGLQLYAPVIVKYRDDRTDAATALEEALR